MNKITKGSIYWVTGLSGAGKTTVGRLLYQRLKMERKNVVLLDGDELRSILGLEGHYSYMERKKLATTYCRLCQMLGEQGCDVVIATVSMFHEIHRWNRSNLPHYHEIYLRVPQEVLTARDQKNLFSTQNKHVVGLDIQFEEPEDPDLIIDNHGEFSPQKAVNEIWKYLKAKEYLNSESS